ncbi:MAG TPA: hypothetical protein VGO93_31400 [Candidatus Xenobia bacterium]|jgi:hypothetical protein
MPGNFHVPRNLLKALELAAQKPSATVDIMLGDGPRLAPTPRARIFTLRQFVHQALAGDPAPLAAEVLALGRDVVDALEKMRGATPTTGHDQVQLEGSIEAYQWMVEGLDDMQVFLDVGGEQRVTDGLALVERGVERVDELLTTSAAETPPQRDISL